MTIELRHYHWLFWPAVLSNRIARNLMFGISWANDVRIAIYMIAILSASFLYPPITFAVILLILLSSVIWARTQLEKAKENLLCWGILSLFSLLFLACDFVDPDAKWRALQFFADFTGATSSGTAVQNSQ